MFSTRKESTDPEVVTPAFESDGEAAVFAAASAAATTLEGSVGPAGGAKAVDIAGHVNPDTGEAWTTITVHGFAV